MSEKETQARLTKALAQVASLELAHAETERATRTAERERERWFRLARTDKLTGLPNRWSWEEELPRELSRAQRHRWSACAVMIDIDRFKWFNDGHGHQAGDELLSEAAGAWREVLRDTDFLARFGFVARYGGEEFAVILGDCELDDALVVTERLRAAMPRDVTCSAGVASWDGSETPEALVGRADEALYAAKRFGRDRAVAANGAAPRAS